MSVTWLRAVLLVGIGSVMTPAVQAAAEFHRDVEPLLQTHCQTCHRPGEIGPMSLLTYDEVRPWAKSIRQAVLTGKMPPFFADNTVQHYQNDSTLSEAEIATIREWVDAGAPEGDPNSAPPPRTFVEGWNIGEPDLVVEMPSAYSIPASGTIEYTYIIVPTNFTEDVWIQALEIRPEDRAHVHHIILYEREAGSEWLGEYPKGVPFVPAPREGRERRNSAGDRTIEGSAEDEWLVGYVPGGQSYTLPSDTAFRVKAGSDFVFQLHYTTDGTPGTDRTRVGMVLAKEPPTRRAFVRAFSDGSFTIPAGDPEYSAVSVDTLASDVNLLAVGPHMHLRGKAMDIDAVYTTGEKEKLMQVDHYDFNWQMLYYLDKPKLLPKGTRVEVTGTWDNSANNRFNPDPTAEVEWGDQSWEEMLLGFTLLQIDPAMDVAKLTEPRPKKEENEVAAVAQE